MAATVGGLRLQTRLLAVTVAAAVSLSVAVTSIAAQARGGVSQSPPPPPGTAFIVYYPWYSTPPRTVHYVHWDGGDSSRPDPSLNLASSYFPSLGAYDSLTPAVLAQHMVWIKQAGLDALIVSWWGQGSTEDDASPAVLDAAAVQGLKVSFMIEPYGGQTPASVASDIAYIYSKYGAHPAFFRSDRTSHYSQRLNRGAFFVWRPLPASNALWHAALDPLRGTANDPLLLMSLNDSKMFTDSDVHSLVDGYHIDGLFNFGEYTQYDAYRVPLPPHSPDYVLMFAASPGFDNTRDPSVPPSKYLQLARVDGLRYDASWTPLARQKPEWVVVEAFNSWIEATQIEPAQPATYGSFVYLSYEGAYGLSGSAAQSAYLTRTAYWLEKYRSPARSPVQQWPPIPGPSPRIPIPVRGPSSPP